MDSDCIEVAALGTLTEIVGEEWIGRLREMRKGGKERLKGEHASTRVEARSTEHTAYGDVSLVRFSAEDRSCSLPYMNEQIRSLLSF